MDDRRIDDLTRNLPGSRRIVLISGPLALVAGRLGLSPAHAKKKRKRKPKKPKPNSSGCLNVGDPCKNASQCCSSICERKKCRAHDAGACVAGTHPPSCGGDASAICTTSLGKPGQCATTTGNAGYCLASGECFACATDAECQAAKNGRYGPNAACIRCANGCATTGGTACAGPDTIEIPV